MESSNSNFGSSSSSSIENDIPDNHNYSKTYDFIRWKSGKRVDPRLLTLLEAFVEVYMHGHEFFGKIFHGNHKELFKKIDHAMNKKTKMKMKKRESMRRSMSMGSIKERGVDDGLIDGVKLERFKVKTPQVKVVGSDGGQGGQTQTMGPDSKK